MLNRPMLEADLRTVARSQVARGIRQMVREYSLAGLLVMNGSLKYSNFLEGEAQLMTCMPYRLWEYASLFEVFALDGASVKFLDVGGAGAALSYFLAEHGHSGLAIDLQPIMVDLCNDVARRRGVALTAVSGDIVDLNAHNEYDLVTCISVLEHITRDQFADVFASMYRALRHGGLLYLTFDYGTYRDCTGYGEHASAMDFNMGSIQDIGGLCKTIREAGFVFLKNDPAGLPADVLALKSSPSHRSFMWRRSMNVGAIDADTPWSVVFKYLVRRIFRIHKYGSSRFVQHNFFRMFLKKPETVL